MKFDQSVSMESLRALVFDFEEDAVLEYVDQLLKEETTPLAIVESMREIFNEVGEKFEKKEFFLTDLLIAAELLQSVMKKLGFDSESSHIKKEDAKGTILIATVEGDIHNIGKNIVSGILRMNNYYVIDLGTDISSAKIVDAVKQYKPQIVALSGLLTLVYNSMQATVNALKDAGLRSQVKIMIGGGAIDENVCKFVGADGFGLTAVDALKITEQWLGKN